MTLPLSFTGCGLLRTTNFLWQDKGKAVQQPREGGPSTHSREHCGGRWHVRTAKERDIGNTLYDCHLFIHSINSYKLGTVLEA